MGKKTRWRWWERQSWGSWKHGFWYWTGEGNFIRCNVVAKLARAGLQFSRRMLAWSTTYCSWCGRSPGFNSSVSSKGLRCSSLEHDCDKRPRGW